MTYRFPDKPRKGGTPDALERLEREGGNVCQAKHDGYRVTCCDSVVLTRRGRPIALEGIVAEQLARTMLLYPAESMLDGEYLPPSKGGPALYLFDVPRFGGIWSGGMSYDARREFLVVAPGDFVLRPRETFRDFVAFYEAQRDVETSEGVVVKSLRSRLEGSRDKSSTNTDWLKARHDQQGPTA